MLGGVQVNVKAPGRDPHFLPTYSSCSISSSQLADVLPWPSQTMGPPSPLPTSVSRHCSWYPLQFWTWPTSSNLSLNMPNVGLQSKAKKTKPRVFRVCWKGLKKLPWSNHGHVSHVSGPMQHLQDHLAQNTPRPTTDAHSHSQSGRRVISVLRQDKPQDDCEVSTGRCQDLWDPDDSWWGQITSPPTHLCSREATAFLQGPRRVEWSSTFSFGRCRNLERGTRHKVLTSVRTSLVSVLCRLPGHLRTNMASVETVNIHSIPLK